MSEPPSFDLTCALPHAGQVITSAHGGGGRAMRGLLRDHVAAALGPDVLRHDGAVLDLTGRVAVTTDTFVVHPIAFPGGDIGRLAVCGTVNDLVATGAVPHALTLGLILEEGLPLATLDAVLASVRRTADEAGVAVVTGDTKVVERGRGHGIYVNTAGVGVVPDGVDVGPQRVRPGDAVLVSGDLGRHGVAVLVARQDLQIDGLLPSDVAPVVAAGAALRAAGPVHCLRDPTRGGLAAVLWEIGKDAGVDITIDEAAIPVAAPVAAVCELLGLDPLHLPCEGRLVAFVPGEAADVALAALQALDPAAARIGTVQEGTGSAWLSDAFGGRRLLDLPLGDPLPRIC